MDLLSCSLGNCKRESNHEGYNQLRHHKFHRKYFYKLHRNKLVDLMDNLNPHNIQDDIPYMDFRCIPMIRRVVWIHKILKKSVFYTSGHSQTARWFIVRTHWAPCPHCKADGWHLKSLQYSSSPHSPSLSHSWRQPLNGEPLKPGRHEHVATPIPFTTVHFVFVPHVDGWHNSSKIFKIKNWIGE